MNNEVKIELLWRQTKFTWLAMDPNFDDVRGSKLVKPVKKSVKELCAHLIKIGGKMVVVEFHESPVLCKALVKFGEITPSVNLEIFNGEERECHTNSAMLWSQNREDYVLVTGFALSEDGVWRRHSWVKTNDGRLIETTIKRETYFGITLEEEGAEAFLQTYHR
jgi:hypothetical protein